MGASASRAHPGASCGEDRRFSCPSGEGGNRAADRRHALFSRFKVKVANIGEVVQTTSLWPELLLEQIVDLPVSQMQEEIVRFLHYTLQEPVRHRTEKQIVDVPFLELQEDIVEAV